METTCPKMDSDLILFRQTLATGAADLGIQISGPMLDAYAVHYSLLCSRRPEANLTSLDDPVVVAIKHFIDSLTILLARAPAPGDHVVDIGAGGGFPGLVLAIARPRATYTLIESNHKRASFLKETAEALQLDNTLVIHDRVERVGRDLTHRDQYDLALSRAVAPLRVSLEYGLSLTRTGGYYLAMKGPQAPQEIDGSVHALSELHGRITVKRRLSLPHDMGERILILIEKIGPTPERYPRRPGIPAKRPL